MEVGSRQSAVGSSNFLCRLPTADRRLFLLLAFGGGRGLAGCCGGLATGGWGCALAARGRGALCTTCRGALCTACGGSGGSGGGGCAGCPRNRALGGFFLFRLGERHLAVGDLGQAEDALGFGPLFFFRQPGDALG